MKAPKPRSVGCATIIGLGGIGRQVALQLAALQVPRLQLVDARVVTHAAQLRDGYAHEDIGRPRVHAAAQACHQLNPKLEIEAVPRRSLRGLDLGDAVFWCLESVVVPRVVGRLVGRQSGSRTWAVAWCTGRGRVIHLVLTRDVGTLANWPEGSRRSGGGSRSHRSSAVPNHVATVTAGVLVTEFIQFTRGNESWRAVRFDLSTLQARIDRSG